MSFSAFWLFSLNGRGSYGNAYEFYVYSDGNLSTYNVNNTNGARPVISLSSGTRVLGSGTATDPWVVQ
ncbi:hypothetical protein IJ101_03130 [Candidatus Saccharibacteria bacterium]|nr:hypothetical protein [Candidatus Saccharibacteria bacterium]